MSRSATRRAVLADRALQQLALAEQLRVNTSQGRLARPAEPVNSGRAHLLRDGQRVLEPSDALVAEAAEAALVGMGLTVERRIDGEGRVYLLGRAAGHQAEVLVEDGIVEAHMDVPEDAVYEGDGRENEICGPSVDMSLDFHQRLEAESGRRGLAPGRVEALGRPTRGGSGSGGVARRLVASKARKAGR